jgi:nucleotide-binding universal stress UspA family protein
MDIKSVIVFLEPGVPCSSRLDLGVNLARRHGAALTALCLCPEPPVDLAYCYVIGPQAVSDAIRHQAAETAGLLAPLEAAFHAATGGLADTRWIVAPVQATAEQLAGFARCHDLAIIPHRFSAGPAAGLIVLTSGAPCLVVNEPAPTRGGFDHAVIAWNGGREARRAVADALVFLKQAKKVVLVLVDGAGVDRDSAQDALRFLACHGVAAEFSMIKRQGDAGEAILAECARVGADLLVMGAYGHPRLGEIVFGGVTQAALARSSLPTIMSH